MPSAVTAATFAATVSPAWSPSASSVAAGEPPATAVTAGVILTASTFTRFPPGMEAMAQPAPPMMTDSQRDILTLPIFR